MRDGPGCREARRIEFDTKETARNQASRVQHLFNSFGGEAGRETVPAVGQRLGQDALHHGLVDREDERVAGAPGREARGRDQPGRRRLPTRSRWALPENGGAETGPAAAIHIVIFVQIMVIILSCKSSQ